MELLLPRLFSRQGREGAGVPGSPTGRAHVVLPWGLRKLRVPGKGGRRARAPGGGVGDGVRSRATAQSPLPATVSAPECRVWNGPSPVACSVPIPGRTTWGSHGMPPEGRLGQLPWAGRPSPPGAPAPGSWEIREGSPSGLGAGRGSPTRKDAQLTAQEKSTTCSLAGGGGSPHHLDPPPLFSVNSLKSDPPSFLLHEVTFLL